jgi:phenylpyruvate tautomerase PptA (4-oxalocrotonate tautomerase family)
VKSTSIDRRGRLLLKYRSIDRRGRLLLKYRDYTQNPPIRMPVCVIRGALQTLSARSSSNYYNLIPPAHHAGTSQAPHAARSPTFLSRGRTTAIKQALYRSIAERLAISPGIQADDVMIVLTEVGLDDWSFGRGEAQYVLHPPGWATSKEKLSA